MHCDRCQVGMLITDESPGETHYECPTCGSCYAHRDTTCMVEYRETVAKLSDPQAWDRREVIRDIRNELEVGGYYEALALVDWLGEQLEGTTSPAVPDVTC